ncbi:MAG: T9SS type A sorting domain-containing protein [Bacteroidota bacterium]|nr:T9SS type A sorting domain-containing protein [Bacteroidota bacterium]
MISGPGNEIYVGCDSGYVLNSTDNLVTIHQGRLPNHRYDVRSLAWHDQLQTIYASTYGAAGLYRSPDKGITWQAMPVPDTLVRSVCIGPDDRIFINTGFPGRLFASADSGFTWTQIQMPASFVPDKITRSASTGQMFIGCIFGNYFVMSRDSGQTWDSTGAFTGISISDIWQLRNSDTLLAVNDATLFLSADNGVTWSVEQYFSYNPDATLLTQSGLFIVHESNYIYYHDYSGPPVNFWPTLSYSGQMLSLLAHSNDSFLLVGRPRGSFIARLALPSFTTVLYAYEGIGIYPAIYNCDAHIFAFPEDSVIFAGIHDVSNAFFQIYRSADNGLNWDVSFDNDAAFRCPTEIVRYPSGYLVASMKSSSGFGEICTSADNGITWDSSNVHFEVDDLVLMPDLSLRAIATNKIYTSNDSGRTWMLQFTFSNFPSHLVVNNSNGRLFAYGNGNDFYSADGGATWIPSNTGTSPVTGYNQLTGTLFSFPGNGGVNTSFDDGMTWSYTTAGLPTGPGINPTSFYASACGNLFVQFTGVNPVQADNYVSYDNGLSWLPAGCSRFGLLQVAINSQNKMFGATGGSGSKIGEIPNPFNASQNCKTTWPGDVNNDLSVDVTDMLDLGVSFNQAGFVRGQQGINWHPYISTDWNVMQSNGIDMCHADCDGSGTTDYNDTLAIFQNYGQQHSARYGYAMNAQSGIPVHLVNTTGNDTVAPGTVLTFDLVIGDNTTSATGFYGAGWKLRMDTTGILPATFQTLFNAPYTSSPYLRLVKNVSAQQTDGSLVRNNQQDTSGILTIAHFEVTSGSMITAMETFALQPVFFTLIDTTGNELAFSLSTDTVYIDPAISGIQQWENQSFATSVFPVPCADELNLLITCRNAQELTIKITDMEGRVLLTKRENIKAGINRLYLDEDIAVLKPGSYLIHVNGNNFSSTEKIVKIATR